MNSSNSEFRSRTDREKAVDLQKNYRDIGISAVAAAHDSTCKEGKEKKAKGEGTAVTNQSGDTD